MGNLGSKQILECFFVFAAVFLADAMWTKFILAVQKRLALWAAVWSASIVLANSAVVLVYVNSPWTIVSAVCGAFAGTYYSVRREKCDG
jgi:hypothetical protein